MFRMAAGKTATAVGMGSSLYILHSMQQRRHLLDRLPHEPDFKPAKEIKPEDMLPGHWQDLKDDGLYKVGIAKKPAFQGRFGTTYNPLSHAVFVIQPADAKKDDGYLLFGRQSPALSYDQPSKPASTRFGTSIENECTYIKPSASGHFQLGKEQAMLTGAEIKTALAKTQKDICNNQLFDLVRSNCISAIVTGIANMATEAAKRTGEKQKDLHNLGEMLTNSADFNFSQGIANNFQVRKRIMQAQSVIPEVPDKLRLHPL